MGKTPGTVTNKQDKGLFEEFRGNHQIDATSV